MADIPLKLQQTTRTEGRMLRQRCAMINAGNPNMWHPEKANRKFRHPRALWGKRTNFLYSPPPPHTHTMTAPMSLLI